MSVQAPFVSNSLNNHGVTPIESFGIEIADKFIGNFHGLKSVTREKRSYGSSFRKTPNRIENTDISDGGGHEDVCNEVFYCRPNDGIVGHHGCFILGRNLLLRELRK